MLQNSADHLVDTLLEQNSNAEIIVIKRQVMLLVLVVCQNHVKSEIQKISGFVRALCIYIFNAYYKEHVL